MKHQRTATKAAVSMFLAAMSVVAASPDRARADITWADTNQFKGKVVTGFNDEDFIRDRCQGNLPNGYKYLDWEQLPHPGLGFAVAYESDSGFTEFGARFHVAGSNNPQAFDVWVLAVDRTSTGAPPPDGQLEVRMRQYNAAIFGDNALVGIPPVAGSSVAVSVSTYPDACWRYGRIVLQAPVPEANYWFTARWVRSNGSTGINSFDILLESDGVGDGLYLSGDQGFWRRGTSWDFMIVVSQDPTTPVPNENPTARIVAADSVQVNQALTLDGSSSDPGHGPQTCPAQPGGLCADWIETARNVWTLSRPAGSQAVIHTNPNDLSAATLTPDQLGDYDVSLTVNDHWGGVNTASHTVHAMQNPPTVSAPTFKNAADNSPIEAVHEADSGTSIAFCATVGNAGANPVYAWTATARYSDGSTRSTVFSAEASPTKTIAEVSNSANPPLGDNGQWKDTAYDIALTVTNAGGSTTGPVRTFWISQWPKIEFTYGTPEWGVGEDFRFHLPVTVTLWAQRVGLAAGDIPFELRRSDGTHLDQEYASVDLATGHSATYRNLLTLSDKLTWDPDYCATPVPVGPQKVGEETTVRALYMTDANGFTFNSEAIPSQRVAYTDVTVPGYKYAPYTLAYVDYVEGGAHSIEALFASGTFFGAPVAAVLFAAEAIELALWGWDCHEAHHDPPGYDMDFTHIVQVTVPQVNATAAAATTDGARLAMTAVEQGARIASVRTAYGGTFNKLYGAYLAGDTDGILLQSTELLRHAGVIDRETATQAAKVLAAQQAVGLPTEEEVAAFQADVASHGFPAAEIPFMQQLGLTQGDIDSIATQFVGESPSAIAAGVPANIDETLRPVGDFYLKQARSSVPARWVVVAATSPMVDLPVQGTITVDAQALRKEESTPYCMCGPAVITQVAVDGQQLSAVPYPPPPFCPPPPVSPPQAVPVQLNTAALPDGPHTLTVTAQDSMQCAPQNDPREHINSDTIRFYVDNTPPVVQMTSPDVDPATPGIQVNPGDPITYVAQDPVVNGYSSGLVDPHGGVIATGSSSSYDVIVRVADRAGNSAQTTVRVLSDSDGDGVRDDLDCAPLDPSAYAPPGEVANLGFSDRVTMTWSTAGGGSGTAHDVLRGGLGALPVGPGGNDEVCLADYLAATSLADATTPVVGSGFWYLIRGENTCGEGTYGYERTGGAQGAERTSTTCPQGCGGVYCAAGQRCVSGSCVCDATSCPNSCCSGGTCATPSVSACGGGGGACVTCDPITENSCVNGVCQCGSGLACSAGQQCVNGACVCNTASCPTGCCSGTTCTTPSVSACGIGGVACLACGADADSCVDGACQCGSAPACGAGQRCSNGTCVCDSVSCPNGCCSGSVCTTPSVSACGTGGGACVTCDAITANSCVNGVCQCGSGPACSAGQQCVNGACVCNATSCASGCCSGTTCTAPPNPSACGIGGAACFDCGLTGDACLGGVCRCDGGSACGSGQRCFNGTCICDPISCPLGCCSGTTCATPSASACGIGGVGCVNCGMVADSCVDGVCRCDGGSACGAGQQCVNGACACSATSCPAGCCSGTTCTAPPDPSACGIGGAACIDCGLTGDACVGGVCHCDGGSACGSGQRCFNGTCICDPISCPLGCCSGTTCTTPSASACGIGGVACLDCGMTADSCVNGVCRCDGASACGPEQRCSNATCVCDPISCPSGCCQGTVCLPGTGNDACGTGGINCAVCTGGRTCVSGSCQCPGGLYFCPAAGACIPNCATCTGTTFACASARTCVSSCKASCGGLANCTSTESCVPLCASCPSFVHTCTTSSNIQCVNVCSPSTCLGGTCN
ncbi:MAG: hypothetical protein LAO51_02510 [Acidobacteriia bacterium]|nr:hypothetical protein [Terriglobia bacterium]